MLILEGKYHCLDRVWLIFISIRNIRRNKFILGGRLFVILNPPNMAIINLNPLNMIIINLKPLKMNIDLRPLKMIINHRPQKMIFNQKTIINLLNLLFWGKEKFKKVIYSKNIPSLQ